MTVKHDPAAPYLIQWSLMVETDAGRIRRRRQPDLHMPSREAVEAWLLLIVPGLTEYQVIFTEYPCFLAHTPRTTRLPCHDLPCAACKTGDLPYLLPPIKHPSHPA